MNERSVQTEDLVNDDLDWDLSDHSDKETQTPSPNATPFQLNRVEAIVQTDYRYFPLALRMSAARPKESKEMSDVGTQTEQIKASVSTQTDELLLSGKSRVSESLSSPEHLWRKLSVTSFGSEVGQQINSASSSSGYSEFSHSQHPYSFLVTDPLIPNDSFNSVMGETPHSPPRKDALELWKRIAPFAIDELMPSIKMANKAYKKMKKMVDVSIQTDGNFTDPDPFEPFPPTTSKEYLLRKVNISEVDLHALTTPAWVIRDQTELVNYLCYEGFDDLCRARAIFRWVVDNIRYDSNFGEKTQTVEEILESRGGVAKDFVKLFAELAFIGGLKTKILQGFARENQHKVWTTFQPGRDAMHFWVAIFIFDSWRFVDPTWGAGHLDEQRRYVPGLKEHFFLTDPKDFIFTHIPWSEDIESYQRWQLLPDPMPLGEFNLLPKVSPNFFSCCLRLRKPKFCPVVFGQQTEIQVASSFLLRYKFNLILLDEVDGQTYNEWVFCQLKEGGVVGSFTIVAPFPGSFLLKVYSKSDENQEQVADDESLPHSFTFLLECTKARKYPLPWPLHEAAWGATPRLYECGLYPVNQPGPIIYTWGGRKILYLEKVSDVLLMFQVFDREGSLLEPKGIIKKEESDDQISISIVPPGNGYYKLFIYGMAKPQVKGLWRLPLLAAYLVECKMSISNPTDKKASATLDSGNKPKQKKRIVVARR